MQVASNTTPNTGVYPGPIYRFANTYFAGKKPSLPEGWQPSGTRWSSSAVT